MFAGGFVIGLCVAGVVLTAIFMILEQIAESKKRFKCEVGVYINDYYLKNFKERIEGIESRLPTYGPSLYELNEIINEHKDRLNALENREDKPAED